MTAYSPRNASILKSINSFPFQGNKTLARLISRPSSLLEEVGPLYAQCCGFNLVVSLELGVLVTWSLMMTM